MKLDKEKILDDKKALEFAEAVLTDEIIQGSGYSFINKLERKSEFVVVMHGGRQLFQVTKGHFRESRYEVARQLTYMLIEGTTIGAVKANKAELVAQQKSEKLGQSEL